MRARPLLSMILVAVSLAPMAGCGPADPGVPGPPDVVDVPITGTVFTIVFENHGTGAVLDEDNPYIMELAGRYGTASAYLANVHPSLLNYLLMTSGDTHGVGDDGPPADHPIGGTDNLADQLDAAGIPWRAYMEDMGEPCLLHDTGLYAVRHDPFVYYTSLTEDSERCREHVVDMETHLQADLDAGTYRYMWITPNLCNDMHDCPTTTSDRWLSELIPRLMASPGYQAGGAIFLLWDEGDTDASYAASYVLHRPQNVPFILISESLVHEGFVSPTTYGHDSYLATVEDVFGLPRLPTTEGSTPLGDFFGAPGFFDGEEAVAAYTGYAVEAPPPPPDAAALREPVPDAGDAVATH